jgi:hypothetical protein
MENVSATPGGSSPRPTPSALSQPIGRLRVDYTDGFGNANDRLDNVRAGLFAIAQGAIRSTHLHGDDEEPRATFTLTGATGESAIVAVGSDAYFEFFGDLVDGRTVEVHGTVIRPFPNGPAHIQMLSLHTV